MILSARGPSSRTAAAMGLAALLAGCALPALRIQLEPSVVTKAQIARLVATTEQEWERWGRRIVRSTPGQPSCLVIDGPAGGTLGGAGQVSEDSTRVAARDDAEGGACEPIDDGCGDEQTAALCPVVHTYWQHVPPWTSLHTCRMTGVCTTTWPAGDTRRPERTSPWSAAFVSAMLARAGFTPNEFWPSPTHAGYISAARDLYATAFKVVPTPAAPAPGDIICATRADTELTPAEIGRIGTLGPPLHCDIVVHVDAPASALHAIGGNVQQTVARIVVPLGASGELEYDAAADRPWILILKPRRGGGT